jgi:HEAT repeat protein
MQGRQDSHDPQGDEIKGVAAVPMPAVQKPSLDPLQRELSSFLSLLTKESTHFEKPVAKSSFFRGQLPNGEEVFFSEERVDSSNHDCAFITLGISRAQLVGSLLPLMNNPAMREKIAPEIQQALLPNAAGSPEWQPDSPELRAEWERLVQERIAEEAKRDELKRRLCGHFPQWIRKPDQSQDEQIASLKSYLRQHDPQTPDIAKAIKDITQQELVSFNANRKIDDYCERIDITQEYISAFRDKKEGGKHLWLGYHSAALYAEQHQISLYIWRPKGPVYPHQLTLVQKQESEPSRQVIHMLHTHHYNHFNLLVRTNPLQEDDPFEIQKSSPSSSLSGSSTEASSVRLVEVPSVSTEEARAEAAFQPSPASGLALPEVVSAATRETSPAAVDRERALCADNLSGDFKHRVFISHRGTRKHDIAFPMMAIFSYFCGPEFAVLDRITFEPGEENRTIISETLSQSVHCLVLLTKDFFQSKWTVKEVDAFFKARDNNLHNQKKRKIIPLFMGLSPVDCRSLKRSNCEIPGQSLSEEHFQRCQRVAERLSRFGGLQQHQVVQVPGESVRDFILNQMPDLLKKYLRDGDEPSLLPDFQNQITPGLVVYIYEQAVSYYQRVNGEVNLTNLLDLITKLRLQASLGAQYAQYDHLERLFEDRKTSIVDSFINLALIKEIEHKEKEEGLGRGDKKGFIDERMASHEALYAVREPLALNQLFEPKDDTQTPHKILILGRAGIGKTILCQYLAVRWALGSSEYKDEDEEQKEELKHYLRKKFDAVFWVRLREVAAGSPHHNTVAKVINQFCLRGSNKLSLQELNFYIQSQSNKILFILDGYDEITDAIGQAHCVHLTDFLDEIVNFNYQNILVTSRPLAIDALGQSKIKFDRKLENIGFINENIEAYVRHFMTNAKKPDQAKPMLKFLKSHPSVWGIAHVPINLELLSWLWSQGDLELATGEIKTLSKLYQTIVDRVQEAYARKLSPLHARPLDALLGNKEKEVSCSDLVNEFLGRLAYEAMQQESLLIPKNKLKTAVRETLKKHYKLSSPRDQEILLKSATDRLGFLRSTRENGRSQLDQAHYFIHLSFQEFYAASYIARTLTESVENEEKTAIIQHIRTEKYMPRYQLMLWLTAGLLYQRGVEQGREFSALEQLWQAILSGPGDLVGFHHCVLTMHCLDECEADDRFPLHKALIDQQLQWFDFYASLNRMDFYFYKNEYIDELARCPLLQNSMLMIDHLLKNLTDENKNMRYAASFASSKLQAPNGELVHALLTALKDENEYVRREAVNALGKMQAPSGEVIHALLTALQDENRYVRPAAVDALDKLQVSIAQVVNTLFTALKDENESVKSNAVYALSELQATSGEVVNALLTALKDENKKVRDAAFSVVHSLNNPSDEAVNAFLTALQDEDEDVRRVAFSALGKLQAPPNSKVVHAILTALKDENEYVRSVTAFALGTGNLQATSDHVVNALLTIALQDENLGVRASAIFALGQRQPQAPSGKVVNVLLTALKDENKEVRHATVIALNNLRAPSSKVAHALLTTALKDEDEDVRRSANYALSNLKNPTGMVVHVLLTALKDENEDDVVRHAVVSSLGRIQAPSNEVIYALLTALKDENKKIRSAAVDALGKLQAPSIDVVNALLTILKDENEDMELRRSAVDALGKFQSISNEALHALLTALKNGNWYMRRVAVCALDNKFKTDYLRLMFEKLMYHSSLQDYLSRYFEKNKLLCIDHEQEQVILFLYNNTQKISFSREALIHLEKQVKVVAKQLKCPLDSTLLDDKEVHILSSRVPLIPSQYGSSVRLRSSSRGLFRAAISSSSASSNATHGPLSSGSYLPIQQSGASNTIDAIPDEGQPVVNTAVIVQSPLRRKGTSCCTCS